MIIALSHFANSPKENPYVWSLGHAIEKNGYDVRGMPGSSLFLLSKSARQASTIHFQWLEALIVSASRTKMVLKILTFFSQLLICRIFNKHLVWTVHNTASHESRFPKLEKWAARRMAAFMHSIIIHCELVKPEVCDYLSIRRQDKVKIVEHGNYIDIYENKISQETARKQLGLSDSSLVLLFLGNIRPYKGLDELLTAFDHLKLTDVVLLVAGKPLDADLESELADRSRSIRNVVVHFRFISDDCLQVYFNACNTVAFPYRSILASGALILAMSFGRPCIAPAIGCMSSYAKPDANFLYSAADPTGLTTAIRRFVDARDELAAMGTRNFERAKQLDWNRIAIETARIYR